MKLLSHNRLLQAALVATGIVALGSTDALAWGHKRAAYGSNGSYGSAGSYGSYGGYGSSGSSGSYAGYGSSGGSSAGYGSYDGGSSGGRQGLFARWHARKAAKHSSGGYGSSGSYGGYGSSGSSGSYSYSGSSAGYGSSGGASAGSYSAPVEYGAPIEYGVPEEAQPAAPEETSAAIRVSLPADATVFVNDRPTTSTGEQRNYVSRGLTNGRTYAYQLRVEFTRDGEQVVENKLVRLQAGQSVELSFGGEQQVAAEEAPATNLTLRVPADATVTLAGAVTQQTGEMRTYATSALSPGQEWDGYVVRVELRRDGQTLVEEKTLSIVGGESYELSFDFAQEATAAVASLN